MAKVTLLSPAKVNLTLEILGVRSDGYHNVRSIMQPVDLFDEVVIDIDKGRRPERLVSMSGPLVEGGSIKIDSSGIKLPDNEDNLAYKAAELFLRQSGLRLSVNVFIKKKIPLGAGLGGGSGNAASVLVGLNKLSSALTDEVLFSLASQIGSDVAFFINSATALVEGVGERVTPLKDFPLFFYVIIYPNLHVSTKEVYMKWDEQNARRGDHQPHLKTTNSGRHAEIAKWRPDYKQGRFANSKNGTLPLKNDLESPASELYPQIMAYRRVFESLGAQNIQMTGSGSAVFAAFTDEKEANEVYQYLQVSPTFEVFLVRGIRGWHRLI